MISINSVCRSVCVCVQEFHRSARLDLYCSGLLIWLCSLLHRGAVQQYWLVTWKSGWCCNVILTVVFCVFLSEWGPTPSPAVEWGSCPEAQVSHLRDPPPPWCHRAGTAVAHTKTLTAVWAWVSRFFSWHFVFMNFSLSLYLWSWWAENYLPSNPVHYLWLQSL